MGKEAKQTEQNYQATHEVPTASDKYKKLPR